MYNYKTLKSLLPFCKPAFQLQSCIQLPTVYLQSESQCIEPIKLDTTTIIFHLDVQCTFHALCVHLH